MAPSFGQRLKFLVAPNSVRKATPNADYYFWQGAFQQNSRQFWPSTSLKASDIFDDYSRERLIQESTRLYNNVGFAKNMVNLVADRAVGNAFIPQWHGEKADINEAYSDYVQNWYRICDVRGPDSGYSFQQILNLISKAVDVEGEPYLILATGADGTFPLVQLIHSSRCRDNPRRDKNAYGTQIQGVIFDSIGRRIAYSFQQEDGSYREIAAQNVVAIWNPNRFDDVHGVPCMATAIPHIRDAMEIVEFEKIAMKNASRIALLHKNPTGEAPDPYMEVSPDQVQGGALPTESVLQGGATVYMSNNDDLKAFQFERPGGGFTTLMDFLIRDVAVSLNVPVEVVWNPEKLNGTATRFVMDSFNQAVQARQQILTKAAQRVVGWVVSKAIKAGRLPASPAWWQFSFQYPKQGSVDIGREAIAEQNDYKLGLTTLDAISAQNGEDWLALRNQRSIEVHDLLSRAKALSQEFNVTMDIALTLLELRTPNGTMGSSGGSGGGSGGVATV